MKLKKFISYSNSVLPHEILLLNGIKQFQDVDREAIFDTLHHNILNKEEDKSFDANIDKRKYSHLMNWMQAKLKGFCTDNYYERLNYFDIRIKTDTISSEEEKELLQLIRLYNPHHFHFIRFFEVVKNYLMFLLVRVRLNDYELIHKFVHDYHDDYARFKEVNNRMTQATVDIVTDYHNSHISQNSLKWVSWLRRLWKDKGLDGYNRYQTLILLSYVALLKNEMLEEVLEYYTELEPHLEDGSYYSRKLLLNYYGNKQLILMKLHQYDSALYYGKLSICEQGNDYVMYLNNYCFNLLKLGRSKEALRLLMEARPFARQMSNKYNRTLFISSLMKCYNDNGQFQNSRQYAENRLALYEKDILEHNWNKFFRTYIETLLHLGKFQQAKKTIRKYNLIDREAGFLKNYVSFPYYKWFLALVNHKEGNISETKFLGNIQKEIDRIQTTYQIAPSKKVISLLQNSISRSI
ncbi:hypothetical protein [Flagellimonas nanhaiensis]|uniref:Tetratricopeptide repeat protein n=1 Tax=Flagellimonas nanhaiensis TaxID=2292706 RepID=A0A371JSR8_9FLAO|nr:hypothetical protein [Allomuricauda nanhaiensis]RDY60799.1 hypothetical protein DX873_01055 [Allomuricauda nanhaiensis]